MDNQEIIPSDSSEDDESSEETTTSEEEDESSSDEVVVDTTTTSVNDITNNADVALVEDINATETDGLCCPICFDAWSSGGDHHVCCLPCGHIYGLSCIKKWLRRPGSSKCPQCKKRCAVKDIRLLYASKIVSVDGELQKKIQSLEAKCVSLQKKNADLSMKESQSKKREAVLQQQLCHLKDRTCYLEALVEDMEQRASESIASSCNPHGEFASGHDVPKFDMHECSNKFVMQKDIRVDGARLFDIDSSSQIFVIARRLSGMGGMHVLTKMSLFLNNEMEDIALPPDTKAVKDLRVSPHDRLVLVASLGKKLSVLSTESNNMVINYDMPVAAWSCSWDISKSHYAYAGLQNGAMLQFDLRQTSRPVESLMGLTENPIHTLVSLYPNNSSLAFGLSSVLSASSRGLCQWNFGVGQQRPYLLPDSDNQGSCISLAYGASSNDIVASYRPKIEMAHAVEFSQPPLTYTPAGSGQWVKGTHVNFKQVGCGFQKLGVTCANVSNVRLPRSAVLEGISEKPWFASADEVTSELVLQQLPSLTTVGHLQSRNYPVRDIKYSQISSSGVFGCLSDDTLQLLTAKLL